MNNKKSGFTLTELLAVVLIIGILASIALPQYRRSIERAQAMEAMTNLRTLFDSAKRFRAASSEYPTHLRGLDISFFDATSDTDSTFSIGKFSYEFDNEFDERQQPRIRACRLNGNYCFNFYYLFDDGTNILRDVLTCNIEREGGKYDWLCEMIGEKQVPNTTHEYYMEKMQ